MVAAPAGSGPPSGGGSGIGYCIAAAACGAMCGACMDSARWYAGTCINPVYGSGMLTAGYAGKKKGPGSICAGSMWGSGPEACGA